MPHFGAELRPAAGPAQAVVATAVGKDAEGLPAGRRPAPTGPRGPAAPPVLGPGSGLVAPGKEPAERCEFGAPVRRQWSRPEGVRGACVASQQCGPAK